MKALSTSSACLALLAAIGCGGTSLWEEFETGGTTTGGSGGAGATGTGNFGGTGLVGSGGWPATGGSPVPGGRPPMGGFSGGPVGGWGPGGAWPAGGLGAWPNLGGWVSSGGYSTGGVPPAGGAQPATGGIYAGGSPPLGGSPAGGTPPTGGSAGTPPAGGAGGTGGMGGIPGDCYLESQSSGSGHCTMQYICADDWPWLSCDGGGNESFCFCESARFASEYEVVGIPTPAACDVIDDFCVPGNRVEFTDPPLCNVTWEDVGPLWCYVDRECTQRTMVAEGVSVVSRTWEGTSCDYNDDSWSCYCEGGQGGMNFELPADFVSDTACSDAARICEGPPLEPTGPRECARTYQYASTTDCSADLECEQPVALGDREIHINEWSNVSCRTTEAGWYCDCGEGTDYASFELGEGVDSWSACAFAADRCIEMLQE